jgi:hypothetical protein
MMGPDTPALGERSNVPELRQAQVAATIAMLLGKDFRQFRKDAAEAVEGSR